MHPPHVPGYRLLRLLGGGKSFQVWEARPVDDVVPVVVKLPRPVAEERASTLILLRREARAGLSVRHPRLVRVLAAKLDESPPFVVLELLPGESLKDRLARAGRLAVRKAIWTVRQVAEAVAALHRTGLVHADIKPGNVILNARGEATLIDLGFAHKRGENRKLFEAGFVIGTANYLAPELCIQPVKEGTAADIFARGATLFECLTGRVPYPAETAKQAMRLRMKREPADLAGVPGKWPRRVVALVRAMLRRDPRERPVAAAVVRELVRIEVELMRSHKSPRPAVRGL